MKMDIHDMSVSNMIVNVYENGTSISCNDFISGDYLIQLASDKDVYLIPDNQKFAVILSEDFSSTRVWRFQRDDNGRPIYKIYNSSTDSYMYTKGMEKDSVILVPQREASNWFIDIVSVNINGSYNAYIGFVQKPELFIGSQFTGNIDNRCTVVDRLNALELILIPT